MTDHQLTGRPFTIGGVFSRMTLIIQNGWSELLVMTLVLSGIPQVVIQFVSILDETGSPAYFSLYRQISTKWNMGWVILALLLLFILFVLFNLYFRGSVTLFALNLGRGRETSLKELISGSTQKMGLLLGMLFLVGLGTTIGLVFLIIPGIFLYIYWYMSVPALMDGSDGVLDAMQTSWQLSDGRRWPILGFLILLGILTAILAAIPTIILVSFSTNLVLTALLAGIVTAIGAGLSLIGSVAMYLEIKEVQHGPDTRELAEVFD